MLQRKDEVLKQKDDALKQKERKLQFQQGQIVELQERNKKLSQENEEIKADNEIAFASVEDYLNMTKQVFEQCNRPSALKPNLRQTCSKTLGQVMNTF